MSSEETEAAKIRILELGHELETVKVIQKLLYSWSLLAIEAEKSDTSSVLYNIHIKQTYCNNTEMKINK